ncbi:hypothetical protein A9Q91_03975 [Candidatus Gracilibacteria bacterium 28_42_T64]|nr:hypothetical protein A9Q91_03975 [Candidatus Gracilibacteria bacterium 28_42_T64]
MKLFIHIGTTLEYFKLLNKGHLLSQGKKDREVANFFMENFPGELTVDVSPQYEVNFMGIREIKKKFGQDAFNKIEGIYYGSDNCEYLAAYKNEIEQAIEEFKIFNKNYPPHTVRTFTFVTPYVGDTMLAKLEESLEYLNNLKIKNPIEVVVNDFGVLRLLNKKYTNLKPIFGRLIHKILKTPLIDTFGYEAHPAGENIKNKTDQEKLKLREEIVKWQMKFYSSSEMSLDVYKNFLQKYKIERVALDFMEKRENLYDNSRFHGTGVDVYYPWALIFTGRLCDTSAIESPSRGMYATDDICPRTCNRYDVSYKIKTVGYNMIQRGNAGYRSELHLDYLQDDFVKNDNNRLVFAPFITV